MEEDVWVGGEAVAAGVWKRMCGWGEKGCSPIALG